MKHTAKTNYYSRIFETYTNNSKETWRHRRTVTKGYGNKHDVTESIKYEGKTIKDPNEIPNSFCKYFCNIGKVLAEKISSSQKHYANYLETKQEKNPHLKYSTVLPI